MTEAEQGPLTGSELDAIDAWWRAANYLTVGQIYLMANPLRRELLTAPDQTEVVGPLGYQPGFVPYLRASAGSSGAMTGT